MLSPLVGAIPNLTDIVVPFETSDAVAPTIDDLYRIIGMLFNACNDPGIVNPIPIGGDLLGPNADYNDIGIPDGFSCCVR